MHCAILVLKRHPSCNMQSLRDVAIKLRCTTIQLVAQLPSEFKLFAISFHKVTPFAFRAVANVCVAREQCVLTLPSEHPIASAVSAISISSQ